MKATFNTQHHSLRVEIEKHEFQTLIRHYGGQEGEINSAHDSGKLIKVGPELALHIPDIQIIVCGRAVTIPASAIDKSQVKIADELNGEIK